MTYLVWYDPGDISAAVLNAVRHATKKLGNDCRVCLVNTKIFKEYIVALGLPETTDEITVDNVKVLPDKHTPIKHVFVLVG